VSSDHPETASVLGQLLSSLPETVSRPEFDCAFSSNDLGVEVRLPGGRILLGANVWDAFYALESWFYDEILPSSRDSFILHAAGLTARESGQAVILAGPSRSGKSTLALGLAGGGHFSYLSEEALGLTMEGKVVPYPKPFRIRFGLERIVTGRPGWVTGGFTEKDIRYVFPPAEVLGDPEARPSLRYVIFPEFVRDRSAGLVDLTPAEILARLATCTTNAPDFLAGNLRNLARISGLVRAWHYRWDDLDAAIPFLEGLIEQFGSESGTTA
jgi:hypothetical protein